MADTIDNIVSQEAFDQLRKLSESIKECDDELKRVIVTASDMGRSLSAASGLKDVSQRYQAQTDVMGRLTTVQESYVQKVTEMKTVTAGMASSVAGATKTWNDNRSTVAATVEEYEKTERKLNSLSKAIERQEGILSSSQRRYNYLAGEIDKVTEEMEKLEKSDLSRATDPAQVAEYTQKMAELESRYDNLTTLIEQQATVRKQEKVALQELKTQYAELNVQYGEQQKEMDLTNASYNEIKARIKEVTAALQEFSGRGFRNGISSGILRAELEQLQQRLKSMKMEMGLSPIPRFTAQIRMSKDEMMKLNSAMKSLQGDLERQQETVEAVAREKGKESNEYKVANEALAKTSQTLAEVQQRYNELRENLVGAVQSQQMVNAQMKALADPLAGINAMAKGVDLLAQQYTVAKTAAALFGVSQDDIKDVMAKIYLVQQSINAVKKIYNAISAKSIIVLKAQSIIEKTRLAFKQKMLAVQTKETASTVAETAATSANTAAETANTVATAGAAAATTSLSAAQKAATTASIVLQVAIRGVGAAIKSIPVIGWILAAISALATLLGLIGSALFKESEGNKLRREKIKLEGEHIAQMAEIDRKQEMTNAKLQKQIELIREGTVGTATYMRAMEEVSEATGLGVEYLERHKEKLSEATKISGELNAAKQKTEAIENEILETQKKRGELEGQFAALRDEDSKTRRKNLKDMKEEEKLTGKQMREVRRAMRQRARGKIDEETYQLKINKALDRELKISQDVIDKKKEQLTEEEKIYQEKLKQIEAIKAQEKYEQDLKQAIADNKKAYSDYLNSVANLSGTASDKRKSAQNAEAQSYIDLTEKRKKSFEEETKGMDKTSHEYLKLQKKNQEQAYYEAKTYLNNQKKIDKDYYKEVSEMARNRSDMESDILIAEKKFELSYTQDIDRKMALNKEIVEEELAKKIRSIKAQEKVDKKTINKQIEQAEREAAANIAKYNTDLLKQTAAQSIKIAKELLSALDSVDTEKLNKLKLDMALVVDPQQLEKMKEQEIQMLLDMEEKKHARIEQENRDAMFEELTNFNGSEEDYLNLVKKWNAIEEAEELRSANAKQQINNQAIENKKKALEQRLALLEKQFANEENQLIVDTGGAINDDARYKIEAEQAAKRLELFEQQHDAFIEAYKDEELYNQKHLELLAQQTLAEEALAKNRMEAIKDLGGAFMELGNLIAESTEDEVQQTKIKQALAVAQVLMNQGIAMSEAVKTGMASGDYWTAAIRIASALMTVATSIASAMNAVKQARVSIQEAETYAEGTDYHHGGAAIIGEAGYPELVMSNGKSFVVDAPTFFPNLPVGSKVVPLYTSTVTDLSPVLASMEELKHKETVQVNVGKDVYTYIWNGAGRTRILNKKFMH